MTNATITESLQSSPVYNPPTSTIPFLVNTPFQIAIFSISVERVASAIAKELSNRLEVHKIIKLRGYGSGFKIVLC